MRDSYSAEVSFPVTLIADCVILDLMTKEAY